MKLTAKTMAATIMSLSLVAMLAVPALVSAQDDGYFADFDAGTAGLGDQSLGVTISMLINAVISVLGIVAVLLILWGGFIWMTAAGNDEKVDKAKKLIISGVIGLVIIFSAFAIAKFVLDKISAATTTGA
jgi:hypothetical protein